MKDKKVKFDIENGLSMFADEAGIVFNPLKITFDFRSITPRVDVRNQEFQTLVLRHNVVTMAVPLFNIFGYVTDCFNPDFVFIIFIFQPIAQ